MKKLYSFTAEIDKPLDVFIAKPSHSEIEDAEFVYAQKFNQLIQDGFLSKAMMNKKFGDIGGAFSEKSNKELSDAILELIEAKKRIEFYSGAENLTESQKEELDKANETYFLIQKKISEGDAAMQSMFSKSADTKAEEHMIKWFILNSAYCSMEVQEGGQKRTENFKVFDKQNFKDKEEQLNLFLDEIDESDSDQLKQKKQLLDKYFTLMGRVIAVWHSGYGVDQESIHDSLCQFFPEDYKKEAPAPKKRVRKTK